MKVKNVNMKGIAICLTSVILVICCCNCSQITNNDTDTIPIPDYSPPNHYICYTAPNHVIIDGLLADEEWSKAAWSEWFTDIEGIPKPPPEFKTRMKMMWNDEYLYVAAELEEPHVWARLKQRDTVIFYDNDFEVFIDPDGDTHAYYELEVNAFKTAWDLLLIQPYRDGGPAVDSWDIQGLEVGVDIQGTINDPVDTDKGWTIEIAIPFSSLEECAAEGRGPMPGDQWRINFSRVEWEIEVKGDSYKKLINPETGKPFPENNWVWSPQGFINMHMPEYWGYVQFVNMGMEPDKQTFQSPTDADSRWILRNLYYRQFNYYEENGYYSTSLDKLNWPDAQLIKSGHELSMEAGIYGYQAFLKSPSNNGVLVINEKGRIALQ